MNKLGLALLLAILGLAPAQAQQAVVIPATIASIPITGTVASAAILVTGQAGKTIYVTSVDLIPLATSVVTFTQGTGAACGTGTTNVTGALTFSAGQVYSKGTGNGAVWALVQGNSLCITIATAVAPGSLAYSLF